MSDGTTASFQVAPGEAPGVLGRVSGTAGRLPVAITLSSVRAEAPAGGRGNSETARVRVRSRHLVLATAVRGFVRCI